MPKPYIAVVGAVNVDLWGRSQSALIPRDSNPGTVRLSLGGVGRNVAHNLRLLDVPVQLITALGADAWAKTIGKSCRSLGIGLRGALRVPDGRTSSYLCISGPDGDLALAVCDADIARYLTPETLEARLPLLNKAALVVLDGNLTAEAIDFLTSRCAVPIFADPISVSKSTRLATVLGRIHTLKPNAAEARALTGETEPERAAQALVAMGVTRAFVSDGANGIFAAEKGACLHVPALPARIENATGCGDAALAALCRSYLDGHGMEQAARYAAAAGAIAAEAADAISPRMGRAELNRKLKEAEEKTDA